VDLRAHRAGRALEAARDLAGFEALIEVQAQHRAVDQRQRVDRRAHLRVQLAALRVGERIDGVVAARARAVERPPRSAPRCARVVGEDPEQPRQHRLAAAVRRRRLDRGDERRLHQVLGRRFARRQVPRQAQQLRRRAVEHPRQRARVAPALVGGKAAVGTAEQHHQVWTRHDAGVAWRRRISGSARGADHCATNRPPARSSTALLTAIGSGRETAGSTNQYVL
jgi:hypothetical protein